MPINIYVTRKIEKKKKQANPNVKYIHNYTLLERTLELFNKNIEKNR